MSDRSIRSFAALGDSFTAGIEPGAPRWADYVARSLPGCRYANLARAGARSDEVAAEQLPRALELEPDLVSLICGANDVIRTTRPDVDAFARTFGAMLTALGARGAALITATYPPVASFFPLRPRTRRRVDEGLRAVNEAIVSVAGRHRAVCLDLARHPAHDEPENVAQDGFHPSHDGHRRAARAFALGLREHLHAQLDPQEATA